MNGRKNIISTWPTKSMVRVMCTTLLRSVLKTMISRASWARQNTHVIFFY